MIELLEFQQQASATIADRFSQYVSDPVVTGTKSHPRSVPFYQALSSITASGKTVILADAVANMAACLPLPPVVLWLSKGKVVVAQTLTNLRAGGKYHHLLGNADVFPLPEYDPLTVDQATRSLVYFATVGTFNQADKERGDLLIYRCDIDTQEASTWESMKLRRAAGDQRRPLIVVYDEAQNLTDPQTDLLMELEPDAFLLASATMRLPARLAAEVAKLKAADWDDARLTTTVDASDVAESGLVKNTIVLGGYQAPMEETVASLIHDLREAEDDAVACGINERPKAIYVSNTNIVAGDAAQKDNPKQPFSSRQAPPILIWRELVEVRQIDPSDVAVYCSLSFHKDYPPPPEFHLFGKRERDYDEFVAGDFHHVIFNLSLQEGWDDPLCYFAYIDKSMGSRVQVEQVAGRLLRQPGMQHYAAERLNTAHFYIRVDRNSVFTDVLESVSEKLKSDAPELRVLTTGPGRPAPVEYHPKSAMTVPGTALDAETAVEATQKLIEELTDYSADDGTNTQGVGSRAVVETHVGADGDVDATWEKFEQSAKVLARWIFNREVRKRHPGALGVAPTDHTKFDAVVGLGSNAEAHLVQVAERVVESFVDSVTIVQKLRDPYVVGPLLARTEEATPFKNAIHSAYDRLNAFELDFAQALDDYGVTWARNPSRTGYGIPLPTVGPTKTFYPDFLIWRDDDVFLVDTKGGHLITEAVMRKLLWIEPHPKSTSRLYVRLLSEGKYNVDSEQETRDGYTVWGMKAGAGPTVTHYESLADAMPAVLRKRRG